MYATKLQLIHYGPITSLDITFPLSSDGPTPIVLVGPNGSGKSLVLSHIVNALLEAKTAAFPNAAEVEHGHVYKVRSGFYISTGREYYYAKVGFDSGLYASELRPAQRKSTYAVPPDGIVDSPAYPLWESMAPEKSDIFATNMSTGTRSVDLIAQEFSKNCVLYFPSDRFERPAWLNSPHLRPDAVSLDQPRRQGDSPREIVTTSPLQRNQDWLYHTYFDMIAFKSPDAAAVCQAALQVFQAMTGRPDTGFGITNRHYRMMNLKSKDEVLVPDLFQLSSGETSLLDIFLSILRDYDQSDTPLLDTRDVTGIVIVDEIDLHLHSNLQYSVLPLLLRMFPKVQFIMTTHSPLFVLGMQSLFGNDGFALYSLPEGHQIAPEEFSEFGRAYEAYANTDRFASDIRQAVLQSSKPLLYVEGPTDKRYLEDAARRLGRQQTMSDVEVRIAEGGGNLKVMWQSLSKLEKNPIGNPIPNKVILLNDCEFEGEDTQCGNVFRRRVPKQEGSDHPLEKGIENLFSRGLLQRAIDVRESFIDIEYERDVKSAGAKVTLPERWTVNESQKGDLCTWICSNATNEDFLQFLDVFALIEAALTD